MLTSSKVTPNQTSTTCSARTGVPTARTASASRALIAAIGVWTIRSGAARCGIHRRMARVFTPRCPPRDDRADGVGNTTWATVVAHHHDDHRLHRLSLIHISEPTRLGMISYAV